MKRHLAIILILVVFALVNQGLKSEDMRKFQIENFASADCINPVNLEYSHTSDLQYNAVPANDCILLDNFNSRICDILAAPTISVRGINSAKTTKFITPIQALSSTDTPLFVRSAKNIYFHYSFVKFSSEYFIYTLRRIII